MSNSLQKVKNCMIFSGLVSRLLIFSMVNKQKSNANSFVFHRSMHPQPTHSSLAVFETIISGPNNWQSRFETTFGMHSGFEVACDLEAARASTHKFQKWLGRDNIANSNLQSLRGGSEQPFRVHSGFKAVSEQPFEHIMASKCFHMVPLTIVCLSEW